VSYLRYSVIFCTAVSNCFYSGWAQNVVFKELINKDEYKRDKAEGRRDQVVCLVGNKDSGMIHFALKANQEGMVR
jgi:hypothetical protein